MSTRLLTLTHHSAHMPPNILYHLPLSSSSAPIRTHYLLLSFHVSPPSSSRPPAISIASQMRPTRWRLFAQGAINGTPLLLLNRSASVISVFVSLRGRAGQSILTCAYLLYTYVSEGIRKSTHSNTRRPTYIGAKAMEGVPESTVTNVRVRYSTLSIHGSILMQ